ncbi:phage tail protein [Brevundimonas balnearis]|uniref:Phage tail protein n=1 Tax=Brevundimonas balnearis TaxID=1572858 RepID=A0ABV6R100_9CAUL
MADPISQAVSAIIISAVGATGAAATAITVATTIVVNAGIAAAATALTKPDVGKDGNPTEWRADPDAPLHFCIGRGGAAGQIVHRDEYGPDNMYQSIVGVIGAGGPIKAFVSWTFDDQPVTFGAGGAATSSQWVNEMWVTTRRGLQPDTALSSPSSLKNGASLPGWGSSSKLSGKAGYMLTMAENSKRTAYPTGEPKPLVTWEGCYGWDPRQDSTYPGGSGSCRLNDPATWVWIDNPALGALKWGIGFWEGASTGGGYGVPQACSQVGGFGSKVDGIDVAAFVDAANIADANGWTVAAYPSTADDKAQVMDALLQACGAIYAERAGKISCIQRAAPRASVVTISAADTAGPLELDTSVSRIGRINTIQPRFWSEANRWQMTAAAEVTASSYQTEDGGKRTRGVDFPYVRSVQQVAELAALQIAHTRESFRGVIPLKPHLQRIRPGDAFTITEPGFLLDGQKCLCLDTEFDAATGVHRVTFVSETDAKYPFAYGQSPTPPAPATLSPYAGPPAAPSAPEWSLSASSITEDGATVPILVVEGEADNATIDQVVIEFRPHGVGAEWGGAGVEAPSLVRKEIGGAITPGTAYEAAVSYRRGKELSERLVLGPVTTGVFHTPLAPDSVDGLTDIKKNTVAPTFLSFSTGTVALSGTTPTKVAEVWIDVAGTDSPVVVEFNGLVNMRHDPSGSFDAILELRRSPDAGIGIQMLYLTVPALGGANDSVLGMFPLKIKDTPGAGTWRYWLRMWSTASNMTTQEVRAPFMQATENKTNED